MRRVSASTTCLRALALPRHVPACLGRYLVTCLRALALPLLSRHSLHKPLPGCPNVAAMSECDLQAIRRYSGGEKGICAGECWQTTSFEQAACLDYHQYPRPRPGKRGSLFANQHWKNERGRDRVCCGLGTGDDVNLFFGLGKCRDKGASSSTTVLTSGGAGAAEARFIAVTYAEDWTNWIGAEEVSPPPGLPTHLLAHSVPPRMPCLSPPPLHAHPPLAHRLPSTRPPLRSRSAATKVISSSASATPRAAHAMRR